MCENGLSVGIEVESVTTGEVWPIVFVVVDRVDGLPAGTEVVDVTSVDDSLMVFVVVCENGLSFGIDVVNVATGDVRPIVFVVVDSVDGLSAGTEVDDVTSVDDWLLVFVDACVD